MNIKGQELLGVTLEVATITFMFFLLHSVRSAQFQFAPFLVMGQIFVHLITVLSASLLHCEVTLSFFKSLNIFGVEMMCSLSPLFFEHLVAFWHKMF